MDNTKRIVNKTLLDDIADAIREKEGSSESIVASTFPERILAIETGTDMSDATATVDDILEGKTAYLSDGTKQSGTIQTWDGSFEGNAKIAVDLKALFDVTHSAKHMFQNNGTITDLSDFFGEKTTENVTDFSYMHYYNTALTKVNLNLSSAINISNMLNNCNHVTTFNFYGSSFPIENIDYAFYNCPGLTNFDFEKCPELTRIGDQAFYQSGLTLVDLTNTNVKDIGSYAFYNCTSLRSVFFNDQIKSIGGYCFYYNRNCEYWFKTKKPPTVSGSSSFYNSSNKIFVPYTNINDYKTATNFTNHVSYIIGYLKNGVLDFLPTFDDSGYRLTWYSDKNCQTQITNFQTGDLYCKSAAQKEGNIIKIKQQNCRVILKDSQNNVFRETVIESNTEVIIHVEGEGENTQKYMFIINGVEASNDAMITLTDDIEVIAVWWDGENVPVNPVFELNSWSMIKTICQQGIADNYWNLGDTKSVTLTNGETYTARIVDMTPNRYQFANDSGGTNIVFEFEEIYSTTYKINNLTDKNSGGWNTSDLRKTINNTIYELLPDELKNEIPLIKTKSVNGGSGSVSLVESSDYLFLPSEYEIFGTKYYSNELESSNEFQLYSNNDNNFRIKKTLDNQTKKWWLRSVYKNSTYSWCFVSTSGTANGEYLTNNNGIAPCFAF